MRYIKFNTYTGRENMQIDSDLLEKAIAEHSQVPVFRLYAWSPKCVSLGRNQSGENICDEMPEGVDVVRRVTGGRALLHDDEITYSYITPISIIPNGETITESYKYISQILIDFFKTLGIELEFGGGLPPVIQHKQPHIRHDYCMLISTGADVCYNGRKIIGSAQYRKNGYILQHGSILFGYDKELLERLFHEEVSSDFVTTVNEVLPQISKAEFVTLLEDFIRKR